MMNKLGRGTEKIAGLGLALLIAAEMLMRAGAACPGKGPLSR